MSVRNPFRDPVMRSHFDGAVRAYEKGHMMSSSGRRVRSNGFATAFWRGFDNAGSEMWDAASRRMMTYAYWRAGRALASKLPPNPSSLS